MTPGVPAFPPGGVLPDREGLRGAKLALRAAAYHDLPFLRALYAATRAEELATVPLPDAAKTHFLGMQFALQHHHFLTRHPCADFLIVSRRERAIGRLYVDRSSSIWRVLDIAIVPEAQGNGVGTALLSWLQRATQSTRSGGIDLHVLATNLAAHRLYTRLGFGDAPSMLSTHCRMIWPSAVS